MRMRMHMRINYIIKIYTKVKSNQNSTSSIKARHVQQYLTLRIRIHYARMYITYTIDIGSTWPAAGNVNYNDMIMMLLSEKINYMYSYIMHACVCISDAYVRVQRIRTRMYTYARERTHMHTYIYKRIHTRVF